MEKTVISKNEEQCIFLMKETNLDFYLVVPNVKQVSIVLGIFPNVTEDLIKKISKEKDKAIVVPVINKQILTSANHLDTTSFKYLDSVFSYLINTSYKILTHNQMEVNRKILLNNDSLYENFNQKYIEKYQGRVELYDLSSKSFQQINTNQNIFEPISDNTIQLNFKPVEQPFLPMKEDISATNDIEESIEPILSDEPVITSSENEGKREPGFVSYILLGVLVAVISLVFLYMIL